jgi:hypothetical protein
MTTITTAKVVPSSQLTSSCKYDRKKRKRAFKNITTSKAIDCAAFSMAVAGISTTAKSASPQACKSSCTCHVSYPKVHISLNKGETMDTMQNAPDDLLEFKLGTMIANSFVEKLPHSMISKNKKKPWTIYKHNHEGKDSWVPFEIQYDDAAGKFTMWIRVTKTFIGVFAEHARPNVDWPASFGTKFKSIFDITPYKIEEICKRIVCL